MNLAARLPWPESCQGAVSLSFDDGHPSQLEIAIPTLNEFGLQGTFYLNPRGDDWREKLAPWRQVAAAGHELGNHTMRHICSRGFTPLDRPWQQVRGLENTSLDEIEEDMLESERRLDELAPEQEVRSFGYPCYLDYVGEGLTRQSYVPLVAKYFLAGRGKGELANHPALSDIHYLSSFPVGGWMSGEQLCQMVENTATTGRWTVLTFHYFQEEPGPDAPAPAWKPGSVYHEPNLPATAFRELCAYLAANRERLWIAPIVTIAQRVIEWRKTIER